MAGKGSHRRPSQISREEEDRRWAEAFPQRPIPNDRCPDCEGYGCVDDPDNGWVGCDVCKGSGKRGSPDVG